jgi:hypothetical protein
MALAKSWTVRRSASCFYRPLLEILEDRTLPSFNMAASYPVGAFPYAVAVADLNGDKIPDLAVTNRPNGTVSILLGKGDGTFRPAQSFNANISPYYVAVGDFNGDGIPDLAVTNFAGGGSGVSVLLGKGDGSFGPPVSFPVSILGQPTGLATADLNHDGKLDLVVAFTGRNAPLAVLLGNGDGSFQSSVPYGIGDANSVAVADLNGDGNPDIAVADPSNASVAVYLGNGSGGFPVTSSYSLGTGSYPNDVAIGDVNGDKVPDLVAIDENKKQLAVLLGNGNGTFQSSAVYSPVGGRSPTVVVLGDFNKDGKLDAATADIDQNTVNVLLGNGDGSFQTGQPYPVGDYPLGLAVGDFNGDGYPDLATVNFDSYDVSVLLNAADWGSPTKTMLTAPSPSPFGEVVTFMATVTANGATPAGDVEFLIDGSSNGKVTLSNGVASTTAGGLSAGPHTIVANYIPTPSSNFQPSSDMLTQTVNPAATSTMLSTSGSPSLAGDPVSFTATVLNMDSSLPPTGVVSFTIQGLETDTVPLGLVNGSAMASISFTFSAAGQYNITAHYTDPEHNFLDSIDGPTIEMVNSQFLPTTTMVDSSFPNGSVYGQSVLLTAAVLSGALPVTSGTVTFLERSTILPGGDQVPLDGSGHALLTIATLTAADSPHSITVQYNGTSTYGQSSASVMQTVNSAPLMVIADDKTRVYGQDNPPFTVHYSGFVLGEDPTVLSGTLSFSTSATGSSNAGTYAIVPGGLSSSNYALTFVSGTLTVTPASTSTTLSSSATTTVTGQSITFIASISVQSPGSGSPTGNVLFAIDGVVLSQFPMPLNAGIATFTTGLNAGTHTVSATYVGDTNFTTSSSTVRTQTVAKAATSTTLSSSANPSVIGQEVTFTATVNEPYPGLLLPTGGVQFTIDGVSIGSPESVTTVAGVTTAYFTDVFFLGTHTVSVSYLGDANFASSPSSNALTQTVNMAATSTIVGSSPNPSVFGQGIVIIATISVQSPGSAVATNPTGTVSFMDGSTTIGTGTLSTANGVSTASLNTSALPVGTHTLTVSYGGDSNFIGSSGSLTQIVALATTNFLPAVPYPVGQKPIQVAVGDFNRDNIPDLAVTNGDGTVSILLGNGDGTFRSFGNFPAGNSPDGIAIGDFNGDGIPDLAVANFSQNSGVSVLLGNGDGSFQPPLFYSLLTGSFPVAIATADLNHDGKLDLVTANDDYAGPTLTVLMGDGDGTFQSPVNYGTAGRGRGLAVADLNGDGNVDIALADYLGGTVTVYYGDGTGRFPTSRVFGADSGSWDVAIGDVNGDKIPDLVVLNINSDQLVVLLGNGDGTFRSGRSYHIGAGGDHNAVVLADFNRDGKLDAATENPNMDSVSVLLGNGDGSFQRAQTYDAGATPLYIADGDFNGDGFPDLAVPDIGSNNVSVLLNAGPGGGGAAAPATPNRQPLHAGIAELVHAGQPVRGNPSSVGASPSSPPVAIPPQFSGMGPPTMAALSAVTVPSAAPDALFADWDDSPIQDALSAEAIQGIPSSFPICSARPTMTRTRATDAAGTYRGT